MKPDYKNWVPKGMIRACAAGAAVTAAICAASSMAEKKVLGGTAGTAAIGLTIGTGYLAYLHNTFSYDGKRKLSKTIVESVASYVTIPDGGKCLDVGCGSGALTIACAKRNPNAQIIGIDRWGKEYASYNKPPVRTQRTGGGRFQCDLPAGQRPEAGLPGRNFRCRYQQLCVSQHHECQ